MIDNENNRIADVKSYPEKSAAYQLMVFGIAVRELIAVVLGGLAFEKGIDKVVRCLRKRKIAKGKTTTCEREVFSAQAEFNERIIRGER